LGNSGGGGSSQQQQQRCMAGTAAGVLTLTSDAYSLDTKSRILTQRTPVCWLLWQGVVKLNG